MYNIFNLQISNDETSVHHNKQASPFEYVPMLRSLNHEGMMSAFKP